MDKNSCYEGISHSLYCKGDCGVVAPFADTSKHAPRWQRADYARARIDKEQARIEAFIANANKIISKLRSWGEEVDPKKNLDV